MILCHSGIDAVVVIDLIHALAMSRTEYHVSETSSADSLWDDARCNERKGKLTSDHR